ncbi:winged helix-turn-helix domain-containing protein [Acrocarpospora corrugata]|uniref:winged helix-turn-helix domain-containing protein n=1 Tax=Acrocarpospora corrugata TaxID=35763 RepID=UPI0012D2F25E
MVDLLVCERIQCVSRRTANNGRSLSARYPLHRELRDRGLDHTVPGEGSYVGLPGTPRADHLTPVYQQIADDLATEIRTGIILTNHPIPSERTLLDRYGVAKATIRQAIGQLRAQGWVFTVPYRGSYAAPSGNWPPIHRPQVDPSAE